MAKKKSSTKKTIKKTTPKKKAVTKKTAKKKSTTKKAVGSLSTTKKTPRKKKKAAPKSHSNGKLLQGERVCLTGRFSYYPSKAELEKFIRSQGGTITEKIDSSLDILVVGEGKKTKKEKDVEQLNLSGAGIRTIDDLSDLVVGLGPEVVGMLIDPKRIRQLATILSHHWIARGQFDVKGEAFTNEQFGFQSKNVLSLNSISLESCRFDQCRFDCLHFYNGYQQSAAKDCAFENCVFNDLGIDTKNVTIRNCKGTKLALEVSSLEMTKCNLDELEVYRDYGGVKNFVMEGCQIAKFNVTQMYYNDFSGLHISNSAINDFTPFDNFCVKDSEIEKTTISKKQKKSTIQFSKTKLREVSFTDFACSELRFEDCELIDCKFSNCDISTIDFGKSKVSNCSISKLECSLAVLDEQQAKEISGYDFSDVLIDLKKFGEVRKLASAIKSSKRLDFDFDASLKGDTVSLSVNSDYSIRFNYAAKKNKDHSGAAHCFASTRDEYSRYLIWLFRSAEFGEIDLATLKTKTSGCKLKPKELKNLIATAAYEAIGKEPVSEEELKKATKKSQDQAKKIREQIVDDLKNGSISKVNKRTVDELKSCGTIRKADFSSLNLKKVKLSGLTFDECNFSATDLTDAKLSETSFRKSNLSNANLSGTNLNKTKFRGTNLSDANLTKTKLSDTDLTEAILKQTDFSSATFTESGDRYYRLGIDLRGVDLSSANLKSAKMKGVRYDEKTQLPKSITKAQLKQMTWEGGGVPPHERKQNKKVEGPIDFDKFVERLKEITDLSRLKKSMKMLKADAFQLFSDIKEDKVLGVVKSQTDASLVYSCSLSSGGNFTCCTQNLNPCGGLRGAICKHILVLVLGLTKSGELNASEIDQWVNDSKLKNPELDKDEMSEVLLKYKGAEAGEIDWRPTETVPEDFFAF